MGSYDVGYFGQGKVVDCTLLSKLQEQTIFLEHCCSVVFCFFKLRSYA